MKPCFYENGKFLEAGVDEAGRGSLLGRVYAAIVVWDPNTIIPENIKIVDSKKLSKSKRDESYNFIINNAIDWAIGFADEQTIDKINILNATKLSMNKALFSLNIKPSVILIDGIHDFVINELPDVCIIEDDNYNNDYIDNSIHITIPKGDSLYTSIAAASIIAKVSHDNYIKRICTENKYLAEKYDLLSNMGYGTNNHKSGIKLHGLSDFHRKSFNIK